MIPEDEFNEISPKTVSSTPTADHIIAGALIPKGQRIRMFSPDDWEEFVEEWASALDALYVKVRRFGGSGDLGVDIAGFADSQGLQGVWDNYQCKRYGHPLRPSDIWIEIGKIIYYSYSEKYTPPRKHYFVAPQGTGTSLEQLFNDAEKLKALAKDNWDKTCKNEISNIEIPLTDTLADYFDEFDFGIFSSKSHVELIDAHAKTKYHIVRFGGGLPPRPQVNNPPETPTTHESRYIRQLLDAYSDHMITNLDSPIALNAHPKLKRDYQRQRERFYHAEGLRNFARDTVPSGTFESLQDEIHHGVVDQCEDDHTDGYERMKATVNQASQLPLTANPLCSTTKIIDKQGICHQLANEDRLTWVPEND